MRVDLLLVGLLAIRVAPLLTVLPAQVMELIGDASDDALRRLLRFGTGDGGDGDVGFAIELSVRKRPFVEIGDLAEERFLGCCAAGDLATDEGGGSAEVAEGSHGCWELVLADVLLVHG